MKEVRCNVKTGQGKVTLKKKEEPGKWNDVEKLTYRQWQIVWQYLIFNFNSRINSQVNTPNFEVHPNSLVWLLRVTQVKCDLQRSVWMEARSSLDRMTE